MYLAEINEVIKASPAIQIQSKITHLQRRAWNVLLANAYNELPNTDIHHVSVSELARKLGYASNDIDHLKETLEALVDCKVEWNLLDKDKVEEWGVASLLAEGAYQRWDLYLCLPAILAPETPQPPYLYQAQFTATKPVHESICPNFVGSLFRLLRYGSRSRRNPLHST